MCRWVFNINLVLYSCFFLANSSVCIVSCLPTSLVARQIQQAKALSWFFHSWNAGASLDNNNRKRKLAIPYTVTSKFSFYIQNTTTFHWLNTLHYFSFVFTSVIVNAILSIYLRKFYFCFQWFIQVLHAALVIYQIDKNFSKHIKAITFSSSTVKTKGDCNFFLLMINLLLRI